MSLTLKIRMVGQGNKDKSNVATKTMRFAESMSVAEALKQIQEKTPEGGGGKDHWLFKPLNEDSGPKGGKWLRPERTLEFYDLRANVIFFFSSFHSFQLKEKKKKRMF